MRAWVYLFIPTALVVAALLLTWSSLQRPSETPTAAAPEPPRYSLSNARWVRLNKEGQPEFRAEADSVEYYSDESIQMRTLVLDALGGWGSPWHVTAPNGYAPPRQRRMLLTGTVVAEGRPPEGETVTMTTDQLWVDQLRRELHTESNVDLQSESRHATATGMRADFDATRVQLLRDVQVNYAPPS